MSERSFRAVHHRIPRPIWFRINVPVDDVGVICKVTQKVLVLHLDTTKFVFRNVAQSPGRKYDDRHPLSVRNRGTRPMNFSQQNFRTGVARGWVGVSGL
jgi:hypothetical protein